MKKYFVILMLFILCICCAVGFAACESEYSTQEVPQATPQDENLLPEQNFSSIMPAGTYHLFAVAYYEDNVYYPGDVLPNGEVFPKDVECIILYVNADNSVLWRCFDDNEGYVEFSGVLYEENSKYYVTGEFDASTKKEITILGDLYYINDGNDTIFIMYYCNTTQDISPTPEQFCGTYYLSLWTEKYIEKGEEKVVMSVDEELGGELISEEKLVLIFNVDGTGEQWENGVKSKLRITWQIKDGKFYLYQDGSTSETVEVRFENNKMLLSDTDTHHGVYQSFIFIKK